jgi:hypothetical protein
MGGIEPAGDLITRALKAGKSVVTANKQLISTQGVELLALARAQRRELLFEASVAGGIPIVRAVREGLAGDRLLRFAGILNGTCNYILTRMDSAGLSFAEALSEAQALGYAEADPSADVDGYDARAKIAILIAAGLGCQGRPHSHTVSFDLGNRPHRFHLRAKARLHDPPDLMGRAGARARQAGCLRLCVPRSFPFVAARAGAGQPESRQRERRVRRGNHIFRIRRRR